MFDFAAIAILNSLTTTVNTHAHADHITGTHLLKKANPEAKSIIAKSSKAKADILVENGDKIQFGTRYLCKW